MKQCTILFTLIALGACSLPARDGGTGAISDEQVAAILDLKRQYRASAVGIGIIRDGELVWTAYYGHQAPGVPATAETMFNTASVNKAVSAETFLRLAEKQLVDLDEPIHLYYRHPKLAEDRRYLDLTPRIILTHRTGLLNWPYNYDDGELAFVSDPGDAYGYSGAGFMILARFLERKLGQSYPEIVREQIFDPIGMANASVIQERWMDEKVVHSLLPDGTFDPAFKLDYGAWNSADDLFVTVEDYAKFLISVMNGEAVGPALSAERLRVQSDLNRDEVWRCDDKIVEPCPSPYGHGIGWFVFGYDGNMNVQHGGNDVSEAAIGYFETETRNGMVVFVNAANPNGVLMWPHVVDVLDDSATFTRVFHHIIARFFGAE